VHTGTGSSGSAHMSHARVEQANQSTQHLAASTPAWGVLTSCGVPCVNGVGVQAADLLNTGSMGAVDARHQLYYTLMQPDGSQAR